MGLYHRPLVLAHRCLYPGYPENTILSLHKAQENGCDYVEIDCLFTKDKEIIVSHDDTVDRCTNGTGKINELSYAYISGLDAGLGQKMPKLEEMFKILSKHSICSELHIKDLETLDIEKHPKNNVYELLLKYGLEDKANINIDVFFPYEQLNTKKNYDVNAFRFTYSLYDFDKSLISYVARQNFFGIDMGKQFLNKESTKFIHDFGLEIQCYPVNDKEDMKKMIEADVDVIQTDYIDILQETLKENDHEI